MTRIAIAPRRTWRRIPVPLLAVALATMLTVLAGRPPEAAAQIFGARYASIVIDASDGGVLSAASPDAARHPASLTKVMTLYVLFGEMRRGRVTMDTRIPVSARAASRPPSRLGLPAGSSIAVRDAILSLTTRSANDVATALGEFLGGTEDRFAQMMTMRARAIGMSRTTFRNASGLPDISQVTTARDMATLGRRLIADFPEHYPAFGTPSFAWRGQWVNNHNRLLGSYPGADGIKTGYIDASGFNLIASARRGGMRLVAVAFGGATGGERDSHVADLLDAGFANAASGVRAAPALVAEAPAFDPAIRGAPGALLGGVVGSARASTLSAAALGGPVMAARPVLAPSLRGAAAAPMLTPVIARPPFPSRPEPAPASRRAPAPAPSGGEWGIQVGAFGSPAEAQRAAQAARRQHGAGRASVETARINGRVYHRAQIVGMSQNAARAACARMRAGCMVVAP